MPYGIGSNQEQAVSTDIIIALYFFSEPKSINGTFAC